MMVKESDNNSILFGELLNYFPASRWLCRKIRKYNIRNGQSLIDKLSNDMQWIATNDPAAKNNPEFVDSCYSGALALASYRLSNYLHIHADLISEAESISHEIYKITTIYIHPNSKLGCPISIDHGYKTFIGNNCEIGDRCIILNGVHISPLEKDNRVNTNEFNKVKIGNDVVICANSLIQGNQYVKDGSFIKPFTCLRNVNNEMLMA